MIMKKGGAEAGPSQGIPFLIIIRKGMPWVACVISFSQLAQYLKRYCASCEKCVGASTPISV